MLSKRILDYWNKSRQRLETVEETRLPRQLLVNVLEEEETWADRGKIVFSWNKPVTHTVMVIVYVYPHITKASQTNPVSVTLQFPLKFSSF
jgi:hypothetical protein